MNEAVIVSAVRTAQGRFAGALKGFSAPQLGSIAIREVVKKAGLKPKDI
ncbi:MAG: acetyl-CoA C-acyltransferase, partial [Thermoplasmatales archaeon]|nr:acetyl-CoA C-acyltransferase [Thermoplasmatales archaeon]